MDKDTTEKGVLFQAGNAARVQKDQLFRAEEQTLQIHQVLNETAEQGQRQDDALVQMLAQMDQLETDADNPNAVFGINDDEVYIATTVQADIEVTQTVPLLKESSWEEYLTSAEWYAKLERLDLSTDPYINLLSKAEQDAFAKRVRDDFYERKPQCDAEDYALAAFAGTIAGLVDIFLVGSPEENMANSVIGRWTDQQVDQFVIKVAKMLGWKPQPGNENSVGYAIAALERRSKVNYDASSVAVLGPASKEVFDMTPTNHHIKNLAHSPDIIGLIFSILDQFTGSIHFVDKGRLISFNREKQELSGNGFLGKLLSGICNWLKHCVSDVAGSSETRKNGNRGTGLPMPGYELFQFLNFGKIGKEQMTIAELSVKVFEKGYDFRFGMALSIPVVVSELLTRLFFALKRYFYDHLPISECIPINSKMGNHPHQPELRRMLLVAHGSLCVWDAGDAAVQYALSGGNVLIAALHLNYFAYIRLAQDGLAEVRARHRQNYIDIKAITKQTQEEWEVLYVEAQKWIPVALEENPGTEDSESQ